MVERGPILQFVKRLAEETDDLLTDKFDLPRRGHGEDQPGNAIDDHAKVVFADADGFFRPLPVFDVAQQGIPADDAAAQVPQGKRARMEPTEYAVFAAETELGVQRYSGFHGTGPQFHRRRKIVRMYNRLPVL